MCATCLVYLILLDLIITIIFGEKHILWSSTLYNFLHSPFRSSGVLVHLLWGLPIGLFPSGLSTKFVYIFLSSSTCDTCLAYLILFGLIIILFGEKYKLRSSSLCNFLQLPFPSSGVLEQLTVGPWGFLLIKTLEYATLAAFSVAKCKLTI
jgi:hypothetical protein